MAKSFEDDVLACEDDVMQVACEDYVLSRSVALLEFDCVSNAAAVALMSISA